MAGVSHSADGRIFVYGGCGASGELKSDERKCETRLPDGEKPGGLREQLDAEPRARRRVAQPYSAMPHRVLPIGVRCIQGHGL